MVVTQNETEEGLTRSQRRASRTRRRLLTAALELFGGKGFDSTTIEDITERADVGKGTFYRHFASKNDVMHALVEDAIDHLVHRMCGGEAYASLEVAILHMVDAHVAFYMDRPQQFLLLQERLLGRIQLDDQGILEEPYSRYLNHVRQEVLDFLPGLSDPVRIRRLARGLLAFVSLFIPFTMMGMDRQEILNSIDPLRRVFAARAAAFLTP